MAEIELFILFLKLSSDTNLSTFSLLFASSSPQLALPDLGKPEQVPK